MRKNLERDYFSLSGTQKLYNDLDVCMKKWYNQQNDLKQIGINVAFSADLREQNSWLVKISSIWTANETEVTNEEAIRYFEFSEPIDGRGSGPRAYSLSEKGRNWSI